jgi:ABC-type transport system involved in cytochrome bd biosynthesis fused ATPase/permease subunit
MFHKRLLKEFSDNKKYVVGMVAAQCISLLANVVLMLVLASFIGALVTETSVVLTGQWDAGANAGIGFWTPWQASGVSVTGLLAAFLTALLVRVAATTMGNKFSFQASTNVKRRLREMVYDKLMQLGASYRDTIATSEAVQISTEGVDQLEIYFGKYVPQFFYSMIAPLLLFLIVGTMSIKVAVVLLLGVPLIPVSIVAVQKFAKKMLAKYWGTYTELGDSFLENLQGLTTLKIYQEDERYAEKMDEESEKFRKVTMRVLIMQLNSISIMDLVAYGGAAVGIILSIHELRAGNITLAECFFIIMISAEFFLPLRLLGSYFHIAMNGNAAADKIFRLLDAPVPVRGAVTEVPGNKIEFSHVDFGYTAEKQVLSDISLEIPEKSFVALVGVSGSGKSTIASLIMGTNRLDAAASLQPKSSTASLQTADAGAVQKKDTPTDKTTVAAERQKEDTPTDKTTVAAEQQMTDAGDVQPAVAAHADGNTSKNSGSIRVGGVEITEIAAETLYRKITRVRHDSYLFAGTVMDNLKMGKADATTEEMEMALRAVDLYETVMEKGGLSMTVTEKASNLSGGQKQRLVLARALLQDSDIYIFDEATSNIDAESENKIMEVVHELAHKKTVILISHRLANVTGADRIYVLQDGQIKEEGTHQELMEQTSYYSRLYNAQQELEEYTQLA